MTDPEARAIAKKIMKMVPDAIVTLETYVSIKVELNGKAKQFSDTYYIGNELWDLVNPSDD